MSNKSVALKFFETYAGKHDEVSDMLGMLQQLGVIPAPQAA
jgi:hypothetical protein